jgi:hypothetical protein
LPPFTDTAPTGGFGEVMLLAAPAELEGEAHEMSIRHCRALLTLAAPKPKSVRRKVSEPV